MMVLGQIISVLGSALLRFALSLYVLDPTGSEALFATLYACCHRMYSSSGGKRKAGRCERHRASGSSAVKRSGSDIGWYSIRDYGFEDRCHTQQYFLFSVCCNGNFYKSGFISLFYCGRSDCPSGKNELNIPTRRSSLKNCERHSMMGCLLSNFFKFG